MNLKKTKKQLQYKTNNKTRKMSEKKSFSYCSKKHKKDTFGRQELTCINVFKLLYFIRVNFTLEIQIQ